MLARIHLPWVAELRCSGEEKMTFTRRSFLYRVSLRRAKGLIVLALLSGTALAQETSIAKLNDRPLDSDMAAPSPANPVPIGSGAMTSAPMASATLPETPSPHKFWDNEIGRAS